MSSSNTYNVPATHRALTAVNEPKGYKVAEKSLPAINDDEVLLKVRSVTLNPTDWKHVHGGALKDGDSIGSDFAGDVVQAGSNTAQRGVKVGDAVAGFTRGGALDPANGAFQGFVKARAEHVWIIPTDKLSYKQAAPMGGISLTTSAQALFHNLALPTPWAPASEPFPVLIWGGSSSVGIYAIKLAKMASLQVATTASPKNHELLKKLGADAVFDYKVESILVYQTLDPENADLFKFLFDWNRRLPQYASELNVMPLKKWPGGLEALPEALEYLREGKASAEKISVNLEE